MSRLSYRFQHIYDLIKQTTLRRIRNHVVHKLYETVAVPTQVHRPDGDGVSVK